MRFNSQFYWIILSALIVFPYIAVCQDETIEVEFVEASPLWVHVLQDTTFTPTSFNGGLTSFSSLNSFLVSRSFGDYLYVLNTARVQHSSIHDHHGFVLDKIDYRTGELIWKYHNTIYIDGQQDFYKDIFLRGDGNIDLIGVERFNSQGGNWNFPGSQSSPIRRTIDSQTGELLDLQQGLFNICEANFPNYHYNLFPVVYDSIYLSTNAIGEYIGQAGNPVYDYGYTFQILDRELNIIDTSRQVFEMSDLGPFSVDQPAYILKLDESTLIALAYKDRFEGWDNHGTEIIWIDISNTGDINIRQSIDYKDILPATKYSFVNQRFKVVNNTIFLSHRFPNFDILADANYILWLNEDGSVKTFVDLPAHGDHVYLLTDLFYANDQFGYLFASPGSSNGYGYDILRIREGVDTVEFISSISTDDIGVEFGINFNTLVDEQFVIFGGRVIKDGQLSKNSNQVHCFLAEDLGLDFTVSTSETISYRLGSFSLFPNPARSQASISANIDFDGVVLYNLTGKRIAEFSGDRIDISSLPQGMYFVYLTNNGHRVTSTEKLVKTGY
ncbi:MAG: T9SS C-terminal target domain-containing protein [Saprospirales bacterium]|nr:MAG: T9SS C-terminal target domain-containing protein [Saprospirales bacterium]